MKSTYPKGVSLRIYDGNVPIGEVTEQGGKFEAEYKEPWFLGNRYTKTCARVDTAVKFVYDEHRSRWQRVQEEKEPQEAANEETADQDDARKPA